MARLPSSVLFACTANTVRSPLAVALFRSIFGNRAYADSAGVRAEGNDPLTLTVLCERGITCVDTHKPKTFDDLMDDSFEVVVALSPEARDRAREMVKSRMLSCEVIYWPVENPERIEGNREMRLAAYRRIAADLESRIRTLWPEVPGTPRAGKPCCRHRGRARGLLARLRGRFGHLSRRSGD